MKYTIIPFFALTSVVSAANLIPPNYYPPNDEYSIFNVELKNRVIDNQGNFSPGHVIGSYIRFSGSVSPNLKVLFRNTTNLSELTHGLQFAVNGCTFNEGEGRNVSIQSYAAVHSANGSGGFVSTNVSFCVWLITLKTKNNPYASQGSGIIESQESVSWVLKPVVNTREQFMFVYSFFSFFTWEGVLKMLLGL